MKVRNIVYLHYSPFNILAAVPLGNRRRFGPAPVEESAPQLAQPSPSAYPRQAPVREPSEERHRGDSPAGLQGTLIHLY